jgi:uncharacterized protein
MSAGATRLRRALLAIAAAGASALAFASTSGLQPIPPLTMRVTDLTGTLTAAQQSELEQRLADFEARKGAQIAVLIVPSSAPEQIEQYSIRVVEAWKLGRKGVDDGALLIIAKNDHTLRIENGYGLEGVLTDAASNRIIENTMVPLLRQGQFYAAISGGVEQMMALIQGEPLPPPERNWQGGASRRIPLLPLLFVFFIAVNVLPALFGRTFGSILTGAGTGLLALLLSQVTAIAVGAGLVGFVVALLLSFSRGGWASGGRGGGIGGPMGGWGGFGGGGFGGGGFGGGGGFSGGGGGFGGGGASGRW